MNYHTIRPNTCLYQQLFIFKYLRLPLHTHSKRLRGTGGPLHTQNIQVI